MVRGTDRALEDGEARLLWSSPESRSSIASSVATVTIVLVSGAWVAERIRKCN